MNRRNIFLTAAAVLLLIAVLSLGYKWFFSAPTLTVFLRCETGISGNLSAVKISSDGAAGNKETFNLVNSCQAGKIEIGDYQREKAVQFTFESENGETYKVVSEYGQDIQSDRNGFYTVLKITKNLPYIMKDSI